MKVIAPVLAIVVGIAAAILVYWLVTGRQPVQVEAPSLLAVDPGRRPGQLYRPTGQGLWPHRRRAGTCQMRDIHHQDINKHKDTKKSQRRQVIINLCVLGVLVV